MHPYPSFERLNDSGTEAEFDCHATGIFQSFLAGFQRPLEKLIAALVPQFLDALGFWTHPDYAMKAHSGGERTTLA